MSRLLIKIKVWKSIFGRVVDYIFQIIIIVKQLISNKYFYYIVRPPRRNGKLQGPYPSTKAESGSESSQQVKDGVTLRANVNK